MLFGLKSVPANCGLTNAVKHALSVVALPLHTQHASYTAPLLGTPSQPVHVLFDAGSLGRRHTPHVSGTALLFATPAHAMRQHCTVARGRAGAPSQPTQPPSCQFGTPATPYSGSDGLRQPPHAPFVSCTPVGNVRLLAGRYDRTRERAFVPPGTPEQSGQTALGWHTASAEPRAQAQRPHASRNLPLFGTPSQPAHVELSPPHTLHRSTSCVSVRRLPVQASAAQTHHRAVVKCRRAGVQYRATAAYLEARAA